MKKQILSFLFVLGLGIFMTNTAFAVNEGTATVGATKTYSVTPTLGTAVTAVAYEWVISGGGTGTSILSTIDVTWSAAGTYTVKARVKDSNGCYSDWSIKTVDVYATDYTIAGQTNTTTCSLINSPETSGNSTGANSNAENTQFNVTLSGVPATGENTYTVIYTVGGSAPVTVSAYTSGTPITVTHTTYPSVFVNATLLPVNRAITVTSVKRTGETTAVPVKVTTGITTYNVSVLPKPTISAM
jgi:hypothetical protein